jgi:hypothetical protein
MTLLERQDGEGDRRQIWDHTARTETPSSNKSCVALGASLLGALVSPSVRGPWQAPT